MFQKFYEDNLTTKFVKDLVATTYLPNIDIWKPGETLIQNFTYVAKDGFLVKCIKSNLTDTSKPVSVNDTNYFEIVSPYVFGKYYPNLSSNYVSNTAGYDSMTHYCLGKYLRFIKKYYDVDLMSLYNCWCGEYANKITYAPESKHFEQQDLESTLYKVFVVPIKYNTKYTLYLNSSSPIYVSSIYYDGISLQTIGNPASVSEIANISFNQPFVFEGVSTQSYSGDSDWKKLREEYLNLIVQVPISNESGFVVLEGDTSSKELINTTNRYNGLKQVVYGNDTHVSDETKTNYFVSYPEILKFMNNSWAFSDALIEYITLNTICDYDKIAENTVRVKTYCQSRTIQKYNAIEKDGQIKPVGRLNYSEDMSKWDFDLRKYIYDLVTLNTKKRKPYDVLGYVDKRAEEMITRGQNG